VERYCQLFFSFSPLLGSDIAIIALKMPEGPGIDLVEADIAIDGVIADYIGVCGCLTLCCRGT
jgi:hypothetical protein